MKEPISIIELDYDFSKEEIEQLKKYLNKKFNITDNEIKVYKADEYSSESSFATQIFDEIYLGMADDVRVDEMRG